MLNQMKFVSELSAKTERFNPDLLSHRDSESMVDHITDICRALEVIEYIKFLGIEVVDDESDLPFFDRVAEIDESRLMLLTLRFMASYNGEEKLVERQLLVPKLVDGHFFLINGVRYYPIYQLVDRGVFVKPKMYSLKTLLMPIKFKWKRMKAVDKNGCELAPFDFKLALFKQNLNPLAYFMARMGLTGTVMYFGHSDEDFAVVEADNDSIKEEADGWYWFKIDGDRYVMARKSAFQEQHDVDFLWMVVQQLRSAKCHMEEPVEWAKVLGETFTKSASVEEKAQKVLFSLERLLDEQTKRNMTEIAQEDKEDTYAILRWMLRTFDKHRHMDSMDLSNKKLQVWQFSLPLLKMFSNATYRLINTKNLTLRTVVGVFNIKQRFLIRKMLTGEQIRYSTHVNIMDLTGAALKVNLRASSGESDIGDRERGIHQSHVGAISLITSSASDPGVSTTISPFAKIVDGRFILPSSEPIPVEEDVDPVDEQEDSHEDTDTS